MEIIQNYKELPPVDQRATLVYSGRALSAPPAPSPPKSKKLPIEDEVSQLFEASIYSAGRTHRMPLGQADRLSESLWYHRIALAYLAPIKIA